MEIWYRVVVRKAHMGTGRTHTTPAYLFAKNINEVLRKFKHMPGVKIKKGPEEIRTLTETQACRLEKLILFERRISLYRAKKEWYYIDPSLEPFILDYLRDLPSAT